VPHLKGKAYTGWSVQPLPLPPPTERPTQHQLTTSIAAFVKAVLAASERSI
jgi:hypothetical protein